MGQTVLTMQKCPHYADSIRWQNDELVLCGPSSSWLAESSFNKVVWVFASKHWVTNSDGQMFHICSVVHEKPLLVIKNALKPVSVRAQTALTVQLWNETINEDITVFMCPDWCRWSSTMQRETLSVRQNACHQTAGRALLTSSWMGRPSLPWSWARDWSRVRKVRGHWETDPESKRSEVTERLIQSQKGHRLVLGHSLDWV